jgi:hypothetical protein
LNRTHSLALALVGFGAAGTALAQHESHEMHGDSPVEAPQLFQSDMTLMTGMSPRDPTGGMDMPGWMTHVMGVARLSWNRQGGSSGETRIESSNWNMVMAQRQLGPGLATFMMMNSLEPATLHAPGSPELFQTGEAYHGRPLVDVQHPHDFFMNLSATYRIRLGGEAAVWLQLAPVGEPALGPTAFMHRASSGENPAAPIGHHWQDSTHITNDVITLGGGWRFATLEASVFHGREPDEKRWNIDRGALDSVSGRIKLDLSRGFSGQVSYAFLKDVEPLEPGSQHRLTASLHYGAAGDGPLALSLIWGRDIAGHGPSDGVLLEGAWQVTRVDQLYARAEWVEKDATLLQTKISSGEKLARIDAYTVGYMRDFDVLAGLKTGVGLDVTLYAFPASLKAAYGDTPVSLHGFLRLRWGRAHGAHGHEM